MTSSARTLGLFFCLVGAIGPCFAAPPLVSASREGYSLSFPSQPRLVWKNLNAGVRIDGRWLNLSDFRSCQWASRVLRCVGDPPLKTFELNVTVKP